MIDLKKKVGPLPVWGYGAIAAAGTAFLFWRSKRTPSSANTSVQDAIDPNTGVPYSQEFAGTPSTLGGPGSSSYGQDNGSNPAPVYGPGGVIGGVPPGNGKPILPMPIPADPLPPKAGFERIYEPPGRGLGRGWIYEPLHPKTPVNIPTKAGYHRIFDYATGVWKYVKA